MNKLEKLIEKYPNEINEIIDRLYDEKFPKKNKKTMQPTFIQKVNAKGEP